MFPEIIFAADEVFVMKSLYLIVLSVSSLLNSWLLTITAEFIIVCLFMLELKPCLKFG